jgi:hypothetical protein
MAESGPLTVGGGGVTPCLASIKLPQFWQNAPAAWFRTVEAQIVIRAVTDPIDKYYVMMAALSEQQSELVSSILDEEPTADSYGLLKAALVASHTLTPYQVADKLVNLEPLGGRKPSELMAAMQKLRPPKDEHFFIYHFLQRLPKEVRIPDCQRAVAEDGGGGDGGQYPPPGFRMFMWTLWVLCPAL